MQQHDEYGLDSFGNEATPQYRFAPNTDTLSPGDYELQFTKAALDRINGETVLRTEVLVGSRKLEHTFWLNRQESVNAFLADMKQLGFASDTWGNRPGQTPLSAAIGDCIRKLPGVRFKATKTIRTVAAKKGNYGRPDEPEKTYHNLLIHGRSGASYPMPEASSTTLPAEGESPGGQQTDECPF